jgi:hypothetical protein
MILIQSVLDTVLPVRSTGKVIAPAADFITTTLASPASVGAVVSDVVLLV